MKIEITIFIVFLIANQFVWNIDGSKTNKKKPNKPTAILKDITTGFEKCADQSKKQDRVPSFKKCLNDIKTQKNFLNKNDKSMKDIFKKVIIKLFQCLKPSSKSKKSKKNHQKKTSKKNRRKKRQTWQELAGYPDDVLEQMFMDFNPYVLLTSGADFCPRFKEIIHNMFFNFFDQPPWNQVSSGKVQRYLINHATVNPDSILKIFTRRPN